MSQFQKIVKQNPNFKGVFSGSSFIVEAGLGVRLSDNSWEVELPAALPNNLVYLSTNDPTARLSDFAGFKATLTKSGNDDKVVFVALQPSVFRGIPDDAISVPTEIAPTQVAKPKGKRKKI
jgi:hypothetical protein